MLLSRRLCFRNTCPRIDGSVLYCHARGSVYACAILHSVVFTGSNSDNGIIALKIFSRSLHLHESAVREKKNTLSLERPFGGLNVATSGDAWQFGPIASSAVYDNPRNLPKKASIETIGAMFWKHEGDSFNCFK